MEENIFNAIIHKEGDIYIANCLELGTVSQGKTIEEALSNLKEATELYLEEFPQTKSDYTQWRKDLFKGLSGEEISKLAMNYHNRKEIEE